MQERCNSIANALELSLTCTNPSIWQMIDHLSSALLPSTVLYTRINVLIPINLHDVIQSASMILKYEDCHNSAAEYFHQRNPLPTVFFLWWQWSRLRSGWYPPPSPHLGPPSTPKEETGHRHVTIHYIDVIMTTMASQITSLTVVYSTVYSDADQRKHQSSASLAFVWGIHRDR